MDSRGEGAAELFDEELAFWDRELSLRGDWAEGVRNRLDPERMHLNFPNEILPWVERVRAKFGEMPRVLDVGSGPLSMLAWGAREGHYELTCVDPLADAYLESLRKHGHEPPWPLLACFGEELRRCLPDLQTHLIWSNNALDHAQDPAAVLRNFAEMLLPGGFAIVSAWQREGSAQGWSGLHQHDLDADGEGRLLCRGRRADGTLGEFVSLTDGLALELEAFSTERRGERSYLRWVLGRK